MMALLSPPLTPLTSSLDASTRSLPGCRSQIQTTTQLLTPTSSPEFLALAPSTVNLPEVDLGLPCLPPQQHSQPGWHRAGVVSKKLEAEDEDETSTEEYAWRRGMTAEERMRRKAWLRGGRGRKGLRVVIVTENFYPKVDGVTRTLSRLLHHLQAQGHQCMLLGPGSGMDTYAGHPLVGTLGLPLVVYPGLKLNFLRPKFLRTIKAFEPDVVHFVDPIWLGAQTLMAMELGWAGEEWVGAHGPILGGGLSGAVVASYHTNLATYATLFGLPWLEPIIWRFQRWLYSKNILTLCPSPSTSSILSTHSIPNPRIWPRGVDLDQFGTYRRSAVLRASWGCGEAPRCVNSNRGPKSVKVGDAGLSWRGRKASWPVTPPESPVVYPACGPARAQQANGEFVAEPMEEPEPEGEVSLPERVVLLYVGRISWEKNLHLLLASLPHVPALLPAGTLPPKLIFVGDGPARAELESMCTDQEELRPFDAEFMGYKSGVELAECYASADAFVFPSFTETFGQVVLEAMASGLPVIGLDADGTRDLVSPMATGVLLDPPYPGASWPTVLADRSSTTFSDAARGYADHISRVCGDHWLRAEMGCRAGQGVGGWRWEEAMERCVDGYREAMVMSHQAPTKDGRRFRRFNRVFSAIAAYREGRGVYFRNAMRLIFVLLAYAMFKRVWVSI